MIPSKSFLMAEDECKKLAHRGGAGLVISEPGYGLWSFVMVGAAKI